MLWTCLHLPDLSLQLALRAGDVAQALVTTQGGQRPQVLSCNAEALRCGIRPGMLVSAALALTPRLIERTRDPRAEAQALHSLAQWAGQFTPDLALQSDRALLLEVENCLRLFGGLRTLTTRLQNELEALGYRATIAHAPTPTAAWLFAQAGIATTLRDRHELKRALSPLPLGLLHQPRDVVEKLEQMGIRTIGECLKLPRDGLSRRFGQALLNEMDRALGRIPDPRPSFVAPTTYEGRLPLPSPIMEVEAMLPASKRLVMEMTGFLTRREAGVTLLKLDLWHEDEPPTHVDLRLTLPSRDPATLLQLLRERLTHITLKARVEVIGLRADEIAPLAGRNLTLFPDEQDEAEERQRLIEHLRARLGVEKVHSVATFPDHRPEFAYRSCEPGKSPVEACALKRPLWLLQQPRPLPWDEAGPRLDGPLTLTAGPERIESGWWDGRDIRRDYFTARTTRGQTLWVFRERGPAQGWYVHGLFG